MPDSFRCDDLTRELSAPTAGRDDAALAAHLDACPACADWSARSARLDRVWAATACVEPPAEAWDAVWNGISAGLDRAAEPVETLPMPARRRWPVLAFSLAQAAAILVAVGLLAASGGPRRSPVPVAIRSRVDIDPGEIVLIRVQGNRGVQTVALKGDDSANSVDAQYVMFNAFEAMTSTDSPSSF